MYKTAQGNATARAGRIRLADLASVLPERQSAADQRRNLVLAVQSLERRIKAASTAAERKSLGLEKFDLQQQINAMGPAKMDRTARDFFIDVALEVLPQASIDQIWDIANRRAVMHRGTVPADLNSINDSKASIT